MCDSERAVGTNYLAVRFPEQKEPFVDSGGV